MANEALRLQLDLLRVEKQELESENAWLWREHPEGAARLVLALGAGVAF